ncbi:MAG TPA: GNAT family N-acetyltransferase [Actinomycetes bacterium]|nr:GNAT family N-acetyltransferase [Actinomycetes bacterium]
MADVADVSVRRARLGDVAAMTEVQLQAWRATPGVPTGTEVTPTAEAVSRAWERAVIVPPTERHEVWVALLGDQVVGFAALTPASEPDLDPGSTTEVLLLAIVPEHRRRGHGSRLLAAVMDAVVSAGQTSAITWVVAQDDQSRLFLEGAGWGVDGAHRSLSDDDDAPIERRLRQLRMGTDLSGASSRQG